MPFRPQIVATEPCTDRFEDRQFVISLDGNDEEPTSGEEFEMTNGEEFPDAVAALKRLDPGECVEVRCGENLVLARRVA